MRKSILACTVSLLMSPIATWALGMGDVQVNSSLNQPLHAEIDILSATKKDIASLRINIASKEMFSKAGIQRSHYLSKFKFGIKQKNGKTIIVITTSKSFKEPYIEFLIEVSWSSGRLIREYTILVDPPEFLNSRALSVKNVEVNSSSEVRRGGVATSSTDGLSYGSTRRNDTLWVIAKNLLPADVSMNQMMLALLRDNPGAFINNNINNLKVGYVLRIKNQKNLYQLDKLSAQREVRQQYQTWKNLRSQQTSNTNLVDRSERKDTIKSGGELKLLASGKSDDIDKINKDSSIDDQAKEIREQLALTIEAIDSATSENIELRERIKELEAILETKSSLMELKDESLAVLQKQIEIKNLNLPEESEIENQVSQESEKTVEVDIIEDDLAAAVRAEFPDYIDASVELAKDEQLALLVVAEAAKNEQTTVEPIAVVEEKIEVEAPKPETAALVVSEKTLKKPETTVKKPITPQAPVKYLKPIYEEIPALLIGEYLPYTAGGLGFLVMLLIVMKVRGGRKKEEDFEESILDKHTVRVNSDEFQEQSELIQSEESSNEDDNETSFLSDLFTENTAALMPDDTEADPLSEADVFMVYGRYLQAEEFLKEVIEKEPQRVDFQMKLLEIYLGDNQKDAFISQAELIKGLIIDEDENIEVSSDWSTVVNWAKKLEIDLSSENSNNENILSEIPDDPEEIVVEKGETTPDDTIDSLNEEPVLPTEASLDDSLEAAEVETMPEEVDSFEFDFELDDETEVFAEAETFSSTQDEIEVEVEEDVDTEVRLDLENESAAEENNIEESDEVDLDINDELSIELEAIEPDADDGFELDSFELDGQEESADSESTAEVTIDENKSEDDLSMDMDPFDLNLLESLDVENSELEESDLPLDIDDDFDLDMSALELDGELEESNAVDSKLDLARAYIDMEDMDSAASLLTEVISEGDEDQKSQARILQEEAKSK